MKEIKKIINFVEKGLDMETIYVKIKIKRSDSQVEALRNEGLFFSSIAESLNIENSSVEEVDELNYKQNIKYIVKKFSERDKNRGNKKSP